MSPIGETGAPALEESGAVIALIAEFDRSIAHLSFAKVTRSALTFMHERVGIARASVALLGGDGHSFLMFDTSLDVSDLESGKVIPFDSATLGACVEHGAPIYRRDVREWPTPNAADTALLAAGIQCTFSVPLSCGGKCLGTLNAGAKTLDGIDALTRQLIELLAPRLAFAIDAGIVHDRILESEARFRDTFESVGEGILVADASTRRLLMANSAICRMLGRSEPELVGSVIDAIYPLDRTEEGLATFGKMVDGRLDQALDVPLLRSDGTVFDADVTARRTQLGGKPCVVGLFRDASIRHDREQERLQYYKLESIRTLAAGIAHDFNNLLTGLIGNMSLAESCLEQNSEAAELIAEAQRAASRATRLTHQLLTFAKGGAPLRQTMDVVRIVKDVTLAATRGSAVHCEFELPSHAVHVMGDEGQLGQVMQNLVQNAVEAMPRGGTVRIEIGLRHSDQRSTSEQVFVRVIDNGVGIEPSNLASIFLPFFTTKRQASGLGLAVAYSVVQNHGGRIDVSSKLNQGTTFEVLLPTAETRLPERQSGPTVLRQGGRVLVLDDQALIRQVAGRALSRAGYDTCLVARGEDAIVAYQDALERGQGFDVVILDLTVFGGMGGREAAEAILAIDPKAKLLVSSGYSEDGVMAEFAKYGFAAVLPKPYDVSQLLRVVAEVSSRQTCAPYP